MPGYRALSSSVTGAAADNVREADSLLRGGDSYSAVRLLEEAIQASVAVGADMPGWLCGRLAALYRTLARYDDEVQLLERYRESQSSEEARSRFDARLSKARTIAERKRRPESGALSSVSKVIGTRRRRAAPGASKAPPSIRPLPEELSRSLAAALADVDVAGHAELLHTVLGTIASQARTAGVPVEQLVAALRAAFAQLALPDAEERYSAALLRLLAVYFDEADR